MLADLTTSKRFVLFATEWDFIPLCKATFDMCFHDQRVAVTSALCTLGMDQVLPLGQKPTSIARKERVFNSTGEQVYVDVQVDLC